jgi:hypothetical protein
MRAPIILSDQEAATNTDILQGTRLQTVPAGGFLTFELQASDNDATNNFAVSVQMPGGDTPMNGTRIPCGNSTGLAGVIDERSYQLALWRNGARLSESGRPIQGQYFRYARKSVLMVDVDP